MVDEIIPPTIGTAIRRMIPDPVPLLRSIGNSPALIGMLQALLTPGNCRAAFILAINWSSVSPAGQSPGGFSSTTVSLISTGAGSVAVTARPAFPDTGYCSGAVAIKRAIPNLAAVPFPRALAVGVPYGLVVLSDNPVAMRSALDILSNAGQTILARQGLIPVTLSEGPR